MPTPSQLPDAQPALRAYLGTAIAPEMAALGFDTAIHDNPEPAAGPLLLATRHEADDRPTILIYAHGDVVAGQDEGWRAGLAPWSLTVEDGRLYGRGTADNKGQHWINIGARPSVLDTSAPPRFKLKPLVEPAREEAPRALRPFSKATPKPPPHT